MSKKNLVSDLLAGSVVFVIAVPLSLGIGLASGMPPVSAIICAIIGGIIVGAISGAPIVVSGPAAGLSAMVLQFVNQFGVDAVYKIAIIAGIAQLLFGFLRLGRFIAKIPKPLLEGVLTAIGFTIFLGQLHVLMGQKIPGNAIINIQQIPTSLGVALNDPASSFIISAPLLFGLVALFFQLYWKKLAKSLAWIPAALPATIVASLLALGYEMPRVVLAPIIPHVSASFANLASTFSLEYWLPIIGAAVGLAVVASAESLLTARAIDVLIKTKHGSANTDLEKELKAQGMGNLLSGVFGGMPMTGVMVRSAANFDSGAHTRISTMFHGVLVALSVMAFPFVMEKIPLAVLASILVLTGWKLLNVKSMVAAMKYHARDAYLWPVTAIAILSTDLLKGFCFGIAVWLIDDLIVRRSSNRTH